MPLRAASLKFPESTLSWASSASFSIVPMEPASPQRPFLRLSPFSKHTRQAVRLVLGRLQFHRLCRGGDARCHLAWEEVLSPNPIPRHSASVSDASSSKEASHTGLGPTPTQRDPPPPRKLCRLLGKESKNPAKLPFYAVGRRNYSFSVTLEGLSQHASPHQVTGNVPEVRAT